MSHRDGCSTGVVSLEGVPFSDVYLGDVKPGENSSNKRYDIISKHINGIPVELATVSEGQTYTVWLTFNEEYESVEGYKDFFFVVDSSKYGHWIVYQGLSWTAPYPEYPTGD